jgi:hypothetical protein
MEIKEHCSLIRFLLYLSLKNKLKPNLRIGLWLVILIHNNRLYTITGVIKTSGARREGPWTAHSVASSRKC